MYFAGNNDLAWQAADVGLEAVKRCQWQRYRRFFGIVPYVVKYQLQGFESSFEPASLPPNLAVTTFIASVPFRTILAIFSAVAGS